MKQLSFPIFATLLFIAVSLSPLAIPLRQAFACSCAVAPVPGDLRFSDTVFSGTVLRVGDSPKDGDSGSPREISVAVDHVWLGKVSGQATVVTASSEASCGYESFAEGERFLIYAKARNEVFETDLCSPTRPYDDQAVKLLETVTGPGTEVEPVVTNAGMENVADSRSWIPLAVGSGMVLVVAGVVAIAGIRRRRET